MGVQVPRGVPRALTAQFFETSQWAVTQVPLGALTGISYGHYLNHFQPFSWKKFAKYSGGLGELRQKLCLSCKCAALSTETTRMNIPMAALVAVMIMVSVATFNWHRVQLSTLTRMPKSENFVMLITVAVVVFTHNLAIGVIVGVITAMIMFARRVAHFANLTRTITGDGDLATANYKVSGELFFASSNDIYSQFSYTADPKNVVIDMSESHIWDASTVAALDSILTKYESLGKTFEIIGLNETSALFQNKLSGNLGEGH